MAEDVPAGTKRSCAEKRVNRPWQSLSKQKDRPPQRTQIRKTKDMKRQLFILLAAALVFGGCQKGSKSAGETSNETTDSVTVVEEVKIQTGNTAGAYFTDITGMTLDGQEFSLSEMVGQSDYVLLDFWASWCGPCRRFIPVLRDFYNRFGGDRFEIISCSVDQDENAWRDAMFEERFPWQSIREDSAHPCSDKYNVQFIPHTVLIDRDGKIVGVNLEEPEIEEILIGK